MLQLFILVIQLHIFMEVFEGWAIRKVFLAFLKF